MRARPMLVLAAAMVLVASVGSSPVLAHGAPPPPPVRAAVNPVPPGTTYAFASSHPDIAQTITLLSLPRDASYFWQEVFLLDDPGAPLTIGYIGPQIAPGSQSVRFSVWSATAAEPNEAAGSSCRTFDQGGTGWTCTVDPYPLQVGHPYDLAVRVAAAEPDGIWLEGAVLDLATGVRTPIGRARVAPTVRGLRNLLSFTEDYGPAHPSCADVRRASARWEQPRAAGGTVGPIATSPGYGPNDAGTIGCGTGPNAGSEVVADGSATVQTVRPSAMPNDSFDDPVILAGESGVVGGSNQMATREPLEPAVIAGRRGGSSVWWWWTATSDGTLDVDLSGSDFDTQLAVYAVGERGTVTRLACDDDSGRDRTSRVRLVPVAAGTSYRIAVEGGRGATGLISLRWSARPAVSGRHPWPGHPPPPRTCRTGTSHGGA